MQSTLRKKVFATCWESSASPVLCLAGGSTQHPVPSSPSPLSGAAGFWSPMPSHSLMWAAQDAEFVGDPFPASPPGAAGGSQDTATLCQLSLWFANLEMTHEEQEISNMDVLLDILLVDGSWAADLGNWACPQPPWISASRGRFLSWQEQMWQQRTNERGRRMKGSAQRWQPWGQSWQAETLVYLHQCCYLWLDADNSEAVKGLLFKVLTPQEKMRKREVLKEKYIAFHSSVLSLLP